MVQPTGESDIWSQGRTGLYVGGIEIDPKEEFQGLRRLENRSVLGVHEDFRSKRNAENALLGHQAVNCFG